MASAVFTKLTFLQKFAKSRHFSVCSTLYSQWPPYYIKPTFEKPQLKELKDSGEIKQLIPVPIRAALNENTSSVFYDEDVEKFINYVMREGRKALARSLVEKTFENIKRIQLSKYYKAEEGDKDKIETDPRRIFHIAVENCKPVLQVTPVIRGGATYKVPIPVKASRARFLAMNWLIEAAQEASHNTPFSTNLATELLDAHNNTGKVVKRKIELHRLCEANRAYAHYRWG